jgi:1,4-dihydroxy-2-naphthoate octaprenyltransferase
MSFLRKLYYFIRLGRPLFLIGGVVFHALGVSTALYQGFPLNWAALIWGQIAITSIQLMTHYSNDYFDLPADRANNTPTRWSGGSRVLPEGLLSARAALTGALVFAGIALVAILVLGLFVQPSPWTFILPLLALLLAWEYSAPPLSLHSRGAGELTVALIVPILTPLVGYTFQVGFPGWLPLLAAFPLACFQICMILSVNFPDAAGDLQVDKHTLVVRLGPARAARLYLICLGLAYLSLPVLARLGLPPLAALAVLLPLPLAIWQAYRVMRGAWAKPAAWNSLAFWSIALLILSGGLEFLAFLWLSVV